MNDAVEIKMGDGKTMNENFLEYLFQKGEAIRKLAAGARSKQWHFGYYRALKFIAETYASLKFPGQEVMEEVIRKESEKVKGDKAAETDKKIIKRCEGCLQCFSDVLADTKRLFSWASMITS
jgi:hypothetical protein